MQIRVEAQTSLKADDVFAWWIDYQPGKTDHPFASKWWIGGRAVIEREPNVIEMVDELHVLGFIPWRERAVARVMRARRRVEVEGENALSTFNGEYRFEEAPRGARVIFMGVVRPKGLLARGDAIGLPLVRAIIKKDLEMHLREAERETA